MLGAALLGGVVWLLIDVGILNPAVGLRVAVSVYGVARLDQITEYAALSSVPNHALNPADGH